MNASSPGEVLLPRHCQLGLVQHQGSTAPDFRAGPQDDRSSAGKHENGQLDNSQHQGTTVSQQQTGALCHHQSTIGNVDTWLDSIRRSAQSSSSQKSSPHPIGRISLDTVQMIQEALHERLRKAHAASAQCLHQALVAHDIDVPRPLSEVGDDGLLDDLDTQWSTALSLLVCRAGLSPAALFELVRGQTALDYRPNKALVPEELSMLYARHPQRQTIVTIAQEGFRCPWREGPWPSQPGPPRNHGSARAHPVTLYRRLGEGQRAGQYVFLDGAIQRTWGDAIFYSPLGLVPKNHQPLATDGRLIHDLSFPAGASVNAHTAKAGLPMVEWPRIHEVATHITDLRESAGPDAVFMGMTGDVANAYRHLRGHASDSGRFGLALPERDLIGADLSAAFGWCGSPNFFCVMGNAMRWLISQESPKSINPHLTDDVNFWCFNYMDDFIMMEALNTERLENANIALRLAMLATFGPDAINEKKFQPWATSFRALGLDWDLTRGEVSMPPEKTARARLRVQAILARGSASRNDLEKALGSLRHVCTCAPPARAFYQELHSALRRCPRVGQRALSLAMRSDLRVMETILAVAHFEHIPTTVFTGSSTPAWTLEMDASDTGLAVLDRRNRRFIRVSFNDDERNLIAAAGHNDRKCQRANGNASLPPDGKPPPSDFSINVREHFAIGLAVCLWGRLLGDPDAATTTHIEAVTDNTAALAWTSKLASVNTFSANINRHLAVAQAVHRLHVSARHVPGCDNTLADAGSREESLTLTALWAAATDGWTETTVPTQLRFMYKAFDPSTLQPWLEALAGDTTLSGKSGPHGDGLRATGSGCPPTSKNMQQHYNTSPSTSSIAQSRPTVPAPSAGNSQSSVGSTSAVTGTQYDPAQASRSSYEVSNAPARSTNKNDRSHPGFSQPCETNSTCSNPQTVSSGGLRSWLTSFFGAAPNTSR